MITDTLDRQVEITNVIDDTTLGAACKRAEVLFAPDQAKTFIGLLRFGSPEQQQEVLSAIAAAETEGGEPSEDADHDELKFTAAHIRAYQFNWLNIGHNAGFDLWQRLHSDDPMILTQAIDEFEERAAKQERHERVESAKQAQRERNEAHRQRVEEKMLMDTDRELASRLERMGVGTQPSASKGNKGRSGRKAAKAEQDRQIRSKMKGPKLQDDSKSHGKK